MLYMLIFKGYRGDKLQSEEWHYFSNLDDLYSYAAWLLTFTGTKNSCNRYDLEVKPTKGDNIPLAS